MWTMIDLGSLDTTPSRFQKTHAPGEGWTE
jgi:hypothetical protein